MINYSYVLIEFTGISFTLYFNHNHDHNHTLKCNITYIPTSVGSLLPTLITGLDSAMAINCAVASKLCTLLIWGWRANGHVGVKLN